MHKSPFSSTTTLRGVVEVSGHQDSDLIRRFPVNVWWEGDGGGVTAQVQVKMVGVYTRTDLGQMDRVSKVLETKNSSH